MFLKFYVKCFLLIIIFNYSHGCTNNNLASLADSEYTAIVEFIKEFIPVFNSTNVPNLDSIIADFTAGSDSKYRNLNTTELIKAYGYPVEEHQVQSQGYLLDIFRIPGNGTVVFFMHGLVCSSDDFISTGPEIGLPYLLSDLGYDVWLGNARGNVHGKKHSTLSPDCAEFWDFSWDEIGRYDIPAMIDYVLAVTEKDKLAYIGHSQGTTSYFVMTSELPEYNDKISVMVALSAVSYLSATSNLLFRLGGSAISNNVVYKGLRAIGLNEVLPQNNLQKAITSIACSTPETATIFCDNFLFFVFGPDYFQINATILPVVFEHFPGGSSVKQFVHYGQAITSGKFRRYDYGLVENIKNYNGSSTPPEYPLEKITSKVAIFFSDNDLESTAPDRLKLTSRLPNVVEQYKVPFEFFAHMDFLFAKDVRTLVYEKVADVINNNV